MSKTSFGRTLYTGLGYLRYQCQTMDDNLTTHLSKTFASNLESRIIIPHPPTHKQMGKQKQQINWEGPYRVINCKRQGSYYLEALDGKKLEHPWNVKHLRRYYQQDISMDRLCVNFYCLHFLVFVISIMSCFNSLKASASKHVLELVDDVL